MTRPAVAADDTTARADLSQLDELVGSADRFLRDNWQQKPFHHHNPDLVDLFTVDEADRLLTSSPLAVPHYAVVAAASDPHGRPWHRPVTNPQTGQDDATFLEPEAALAAFEAGATVILYELRAWSPRIDEFAGALEDGLGHRVGVNAYLTAAHTTGLAHHYDPHDVLIVQVHGSKRWSVCEPFIENPTASHMPDRNGAAQLATEITLTPGDVLYVPRGWPHSTSTQDNASLHLTIAVVPTTYLDLLELTLKALGDDPELRAALPAGFHRDVDLATQLVGHALGALTDRAASLEGLTAVLRELAQARTPRQYTRRGALSEQLDP